MLLRQANGGDLLAPRRPLVGGAAQGVHAHDVLGGAVGQAGALQLTDAKESAVGAGPRK
ncbi:hypothetical protein [Streptomyces sp. NBC_00328]|uniref:hypothetical protein n=1 Tax=Streptomyces sp. NBC_00328 TaxID=2903646 RepID=UPI002E2D0658|nr:hypothetical protein [Streptomyces sp. NBC_00328]